MCLYRDCAKENISVAWIHFLLCKLINKHEFRTSYWDTDEFITFEQEADIDKTMRKMEEPGYVLKTLNAIKKKVNDTGVSCEAVNRRRYCAKDLDAREIDLALAAGAIIPEGFAMKDDGHRADGGQLSPRARAFRRFDTLRYNFLTPGLDGQPKSFIDLSRPNTKSFAGQWKVHRVMDPLCKNEMWHSRGTRGEEAKRLLGEERFVLNHYLGDWPSYSFRDDARRGGLRSYDVWRDRANMTQGEFTRGIWPWLGGFVDLVGRGAGGGPEVAAHLLQDAGRFPKGFDPWANIGFYKKTYKYN